MSEICPFVFINLLGPPSISNIFFTFGVWARLASIKCRFVPLSKESIRLFLSRLPVRGSNLRHPAAGARSNSTSYQAGNLVSKLGVKADRLPENQRKKEVPSFSPAPWLLAPPFRLARGDFADFDGTVASTIKDCEMLLRGVFVARASRPLGRGHPARATFPAFAAGGCPKSAIGNGRPCPQRCSGVR